MNSKGGVEGYRIKYVEIDHEYKVPAGVEAYQTEKRDGAISISYQSSQNYSTGGGAGAEPEPD